MSDASRLPSATAIVLAGGEATRFGRDKLSEPIGGIPLIEHVLAAIAPLVTEIVIAGGPDRPYGEGSAIPVRAIPDPEEHGGPLVGVLAGLEAAAEPTSLVVAGDMPRLAPAVLGLLIRTLHAAEPETMDGAALVHRGRIEPLPVVVRTGAATSAARRTLGHGSRSLYAWLDELRIRAVEEGAWRPLDPPAATLLDVDRPSDLDRLR